jgi:hypothetical protein
VVADLHWSEEKQMYCDANVDDEGNSRRTGGREAGAGRDQDGARDPEREHAFGRGETELVHV